MQLTAADRGGITLRESRVSTTTSPTSSPPAAAAWRPIASSSPPQRAWTVPRAAGSGTRLGGGANVERSRQQTAHPYLGSPEGVARLISGSPARDAHRRSRDYGCAGLRPHGDGTYSIGHIA